MGKQVRVKEERRVKRRSKNLVPTDIEIFIYILSLHLFLLDFQISLLFEGHWWPHEPVYHS